jgi:uncharacterized membrane-anchored protein
MHEQVKQVISKVPEVTLGFWVIKVIATTLGETGGDAVTMTLGLGYLVGTAIFAALFIVAIGGWRHVPDCGRVSAGDGG